MAAGTRRRPHSVARARGCAAAETLTEEQQELVDSAAELLYGLVHARFIVTSRGLNAMVGRGRGGGGRGA